MKPRLLLTDEDIRRRVFEALDNALENGYDPRAKPALENAIDLGTYDAGLEGMEPSQLIPHVLAWMTQQPKQAM